MTEHRRSADLPLVSVVTPFHDSAEDLEECIKSVLAQDYGNIEYILVDNESADGSGEIARRFAAIDDRVRFATTDELLPQVDNYNFALTLISRESKYVKICQADDWLFPSCVSEMVASFEAQDTTVLVSAYFHRGRRIDHLGLPVEIRHMCGRAACRLRLIDDVYLFGNPTVVMYRAEDVRSASPFFETGRLHEDTEACFPTPHQWRPRLRASGAVLRPRGSRIDHRTATAIPPEQPRRPDPAQALRPELSDGARVQVGLGAC